MIDPPLFWVSIGLPLNALSVFGVMGAPDKAAVPLLFIMAKNAAVFGLGGGKDPDVAPNGVSPVLKLERSGVKPVRKVDGSKLCGPANIAGESGPARREPESEVFQGYWRALSCAAGEVMLDTGGKMRLFRDCPGVTGPLLFLVSDLDDSSLRSSLSCLTPTSDLVGLWPSFFSLF